MGDMTNANVNPSAPAVSAGDVGDLIDKTSSFAKNNKLPPVMSFSMYVVLVGIIAILIIILVPTLSITEKLISIVAIGALALGMSKMAFSVYREHQQLEYRTKIANKKQS